MDIASDFTVAAPPATVYTALLDLERVGPCIPGATVGPAAEDGAHPAEIAVRLGPMRLTYRGTVRVQERDEAAHTATLLADVREVRGQGSARARMSMAVTADGGGGAHVGSTTTVELTGRAAQMGAGIVEDVASRLVADMAERLEQLLAPAASGEGPAPADGGPDGSSGGSVEPARPIGGLRLLLRALWYRLRHGRQRADA